MELFRYDTHVHTSEGSACAATSGAEMARLYHAAGYTGIFITDHFFNGNTAVPADLPWEARVSALLAGYRNAKEEGDRLGLAVFPGWEYGYGGSDFLTYGLDADWLLQHPDILSDAPERYMRRVRADGGMIIQAHPFREEPYLRMIRLFPAEVDGVEVINGGNRNPMFNRRASWYAESYGLPATAGSDAHAPWQIATGVLSPTRFATAQDYIQAVKGGKLLLMGRNALQ